MGVPSALVTGASGLLGHEVARQLVQLGSTVTCLGQRRDGLYPDGTTVVVTDLHADPRPALTAVKADVVVHLAQSPWFRSPEGRRPEMLAVNVAATVQLAEWAAEKSHRVVFASTGSVYAPAEGPRREDDPVVGPSDAPNFYAASKLASELLLCEFRRAIDVAVVRPFFVYGPRQGETMLMQRLRASVRDQRPVTLAGHEGLRINPVYVTDAARILIAAMLREDVPEVCNVAGTEVVSIRRICEILGASLGRAPIFEESDGDAPWVVGDTSLMVERLGSPIVGLADGLRSLVR